MPDGIETAACACGARFERPVIVLFGARHFVQQQCTACVESENTRRQLEVAREKTIERESQWNEICPLIYRDTNLDDARLSRPAVRAATQWTPDAARGLGLLGVTGAGKTRCLFLALRRAFLEGRTCAAVSHNQFSRLAMDAFSGGDEERREARRRLQRYRQSRVLLLDDLGKPPSTERADAELEELVEHRTARGLPILWSANGSGEWLIQRFGADRGEPLVRRLGEFCEVVTVA